MIAALFVLLTGLVAAAVIERPSSAFVALLIVCFKLWLWQQHANQGFDSYAINEGWAAILLCILASRLHWVLGSVLVGVYGFSLVASWDVMDCTGLSDLQWWVNLAALLASAVSVRRAAVSVESAPDGVGLSMDSEYREAGRIFAEGSPRIP